MLLTDGVTGSQIKTEYALIAQSVEHAAVNRGVTGSSPVSFCKDLDLQGFFDTI